MDAAKEEAAKPKGATETFIDNLLVRIHLIIVMIRWTGLSPWEFEFAFPGSLTSTFLVRLTHKLSQEPDSDQPDARWMMMSCSGARYLTRRCRAG